MNTNWKIWDKWPGYGDLLFKRATGDLEEMQSSISVCEHINEIYNPGMNLLDVGCGAGHYLRSLRKRGDSNIDYTGVDATKKYIELAKIAFQNANFVDGDIYQLPFEDNQFDIVMSNNVLLHLPPSIVKPISELIRVSKRFVIIRTVIGERNYIIQEVRASGEMSDNIDLSDNEYDEANILDSNGNPLSFNYFNMFTEKYLCDLIRKNNSKVDVSIVKDNNMFFDNRTVGGKTATHFIGENQVSGNLILDWRFIIIEKK